MRSDRLLALLLLLQTRGRVIAPDVAAELEVSVRTVYRDVEALSSAGVPVWTEQGRGGGIVLMPGYRTDLTGLTLGESRALVALTGRAVPDDAGLGNDLTTAVHKLIAAVPASHRAAAEQARARVLVDHTGWNRGPANQGGCQDRLESVQEAVWSDRRIHVRYRHSHGTEGAYTLDPYGIVVKAGVWYLVAARRGRARLWRVDRVQDIQVRNEAARRPDDVDLGAVWEQLRAEVERPRAQVQVRLRVRAGLLGRLLRVTAAQRTGPDPDLKPPPDPSGRVEVTLGFRAPQAAAASLLGFGDAVEVLHPPQVRDRMIETARAVLEQYNA